MRQARIVLENREALYYLCNEIKLELPNLKAKDKALLEVTIFQTAEFCKIDILSYTIHNRGYAMLIRIPKPEPIEEEKLIASVKRYYEKTEKNEELRRVCANPSSAEYTNVMNKHRKKLYNLIEFAGMYGRRFSINYNKKYKREGHVWRQRFTSLLVENKTDFLLSAIAYIHTRPIVKGTPKGTGKAFSSWNKAISGDIKWQKQYALLSDQDNWESAQKKISPRFKVMKGRKARPYLGEVDQTLVNQYLKKNKLPLNIQKERELYREKMFRQLEQYGKKDKNFIFPRASKKYKELLSWIRLQRKYYLRGVLKQEYIDEFKRIGYPIENRNVFYPNTSTSDHDGLSIWSVNFEKVRKYFSEKGNTPPFKDKTIAKWVRVQRYLYNKGTLSEDKIQKLNAIGFPWEK